MAQAHAQARRTGPIKPMLRQRKASGERLAEGQEPGSNVLRLATAHAPEGSGKAAERNPKLQNGPICVILCVEIHTWRQIYQSILL
jgi:hypothetical protein